MSSVTPVPELARTDVGRLTPRNAFCAVRGHGLWPLTRESLVRFRYGDGFSHSRALGLQLSLAAVPLVIAGVGLATELRTASLGVLLRRTILELTPGASKPLVRDALSPFPEAPEGNVLALLLALAVALAALTTGMGQLERGANRIYGIQRDRPSTAKYSRALVLALVAGLPAMAGFVLLVTADAFAEAVESVYGQEDEIVLLLTHPLAAALLLAAITTMLRRSPARQQPSWSLLALGGLLALVLWVSLTALLGGFLSVSSDIGSIYGPLTGIMALLVWAQLTAASLFLALAVSAELEAAYVGRLTADVAQVQGDDAPATAAQGGPHGRERAREDVDQLTPRHH
jgi:uncharacterized BrkB/YihY/UPF0761 family membrane protein